MYQSAKDLVAAEGCQKYVCLVSNYNIEIGTGQVIWANLIFQNQTLGKVMFIARFFFAIPFKVGSAFCLICYSGNRTTKTAQYIDQTAVCSRMHLQRIFQIWTSCLFLKNSGYFMMQEPIFSIFFLIVQWILRVLLRTLFPMFFQFLVLKNS